MAQPFNAVLLSNEKEPTGRDIADALSHSGSQTSYLLSSLGHKLCPHPARVRTYRLTLCLHGTLEILKRQNS